MQLLLLDFLYMDLHLELLVLLVVFQGHQLDQQNRLMHLLLLMMQ